MECCRKVESLLKRNKVGITELTWPEMEIPAQMKAVIERGGYGEMANESGVDPELLEKLQRLQERAREIEMTESTLQSDFWKLRDKFRMLHP
jgi:hypothetical protein